LNILAFISVTGRGVLCIVVGGYIGDHYHLAFASKLNVL